MKTTKIIFLLGESRSGKDTVGKAFLKHGYIRVSFADIMKEEYAKQIGIDVSELHIQGPKKESHRAGIIQFAEAARAIDSLTWLNKAFEKYRDIDGSFKEGLKLVITDFRRDSEVDWFYDLWSTIRSFEYNSNPMLTKEHYIDLKMFYILNPDSGDTDVLTHYTIGKAFGINKIYPGFISGTIHNNICAGKEITDAQYKIMKESLEKKTSKLIEIFDL